MKKKLLLKIAVSSSLLVTGLLNPFQALAAGATLVLTPATGTLNRGCEYTINIDLDTAGIQTDGTDAVLIYEPTKMKVNKINNGTIYQDYPGNSIDSQTGKINVSGLAQPETPFSSKGTLASLDVTILSTAALGSATINFDFDPNNKSKTTDSNVVERGTIRDVLDSVTNGSYTIGTGTCTSKATTTTTTGSTNFTSNANPKTIPQYQGGVSSDSSQLKTLPNGALTTPTIILSALGGILVVLGILGLALL